MQNPTVHHILAAAGCPSEKGGGQEEKKLGVLGKDGIGTEVGKALSLQSAPQQLRADGNGHKWTFTSPNFLIKKYRELKKIELTRLCLLPLIDTAFYP